MSRLSARWGSRVAPALAALALVAGVGALPSAPASAVSSVGVTGLIVTEASGVVTASWSGGIVPVLRHPRSTHDSPRGAYTYFTCSLLYGWGTPTTATQTTSGHQCSFYNLDTSRSWGVEVEAYFSEGEAFGSPQVAFGQPVASPASAKPVIRTIVCKRGSSLRAVSGVHPHCPAHYHRVA
jgi:hypothetical protein